MKSKVGVFLSKKPDEKRLPLIVEHLLSLPCAVRRQLIFEKGYGHSLEIEDAFFERHAGGVLDRDELLENVDIAVILKTSLLDLNTLKHGATLCGWIHAEQNFEIVQAAINRKLTFMAFEQMHHYLDNGRTHVFYKNNEIAGEMGIFEALRYCGWFPIFSNPMKAAVISYGSVGKGAVLGLQKMGVKDITVYSRRHPETISDQTHGVFYRQIVKTQGGLVNVFEMGSLLDALSSVDIIVNAIAQDVNSPWMFVSRSEVHRLKQNAIIIDVSSDYHLGFDFSEPTTFKNPVRRIENIFYYSVDHIPSCVWRTASQEISGALLPFWQDLVGGKRAWRENLTIKNAIEIDQGLINNQKVLLFQRRSPQYPYPKL